MRELLRYGSVALLLLAGCARMGNPPGGPPDFRAPILLATFPESTVVLPGFTGWAEFKFDETVSEGAQPNFGLGTGDLERLVLLSPSKSGEVPQVEWHRSRITVRPRHGWRANTVYRIELIPGLRDLSDGGRNEVKVSHVITFATGGPVPTRFIEGRAVDWLSRQFLPRALVEAMLLPDSLVYRSVADSNGRFRIGPLPTGELLVGVTTDQNRNAARDPKEAWDSVRIAATASRVGEVWAFSRDTLPPKLTGVARTDSANITLTFSMPIDPLLALPEDSIRVLLIPDSTNSKADSSSIGPMSALPKAAHDSAYRARDEAARNAAAAAAAAAKRDSAKADTTTKADTTARPKARAAVPSVLSEKESADTVPKDEPLEKRLPLGTQLVIRTRGHTELGRSYWIELRGVRTAGGTTGNVTRKLVLPKPPPPPKAATDSLKPTGDSLKPKPKRDSLSAKPVPRP